MKKVVIIVLVICAPLFVVVGLICYRFSHDAITRISGRKFDSKLLQEVASSTKIYFPAGSRGLDYYGEAGFRDSAFAAKISIPKEGRTEFLQNEIFHAGKNTVPYIQTGKKEKWWRLPELEHRVDRMVEFPRAIVECSFGDEESTSVAYITWWHH